MSPRRLQTSANAPRDRPILFGGPMVRAILEGRKTQTRRVIKPIQPRADGLWPAGRNPLEDCPYGQPGDRLWVRETWAKVKHPPAASPRCKVGPHGWGATWRADWTDNPSGYTWKPSIHMPRWASRLTLEVTEVRVQRLQEITQEDALAEGCEPSEIAKVVGGALGGTPKTFFNLLWESINGERPGCSWEANPWVWAVSFKRVGG